MIIKIKVSALWEYVIEDLNGEEIFRRCYKKILQKTNQTEFRVKKVM